jgi:hypothetical protein
LLLRQALNLILHEGLHLGLHLDIRQLHFRHLSGQLLCLLRPAVRLGRGVILGRAPPLGRLLGMLPFDLGQSLGRHHLGEQPIVCRSQFGREGGRCFCLDVGRSRRGFGLFGCQGRCDLGLCFRSILYVNSIELFKKASEDW